MFTQGLGWLKGVGRWLLEPALVWTLVAVPVLVVLVSIWLAPHVDSGIRYAGLVLELAGICTVVIGLRDKWRTFNRPGLLRLLADWLRRFPGRSQNVYAHVGTAHLKIGGTANAHGWHGTSQSASLAQRLDALEKNLETVRQIVLQTKQELTKEAAELRNKIGEEQRARVAADQVIKRELEEFGAGNLDVEAVGLAWLILGLVFGSIPQEIARILAF